MKPASILLAVSLIFLAFTGTEIDLKNNRYRSYSKWLGLFKSGSWKSLDPIQELIVILSQLGYTIYSRGNRPLDVKKKDYRVIMKGMHPKEKVVVMAVKSPEEAREQANKLGSSMGLPVA